MVVSGLYISSDSYWCKMKKDSITEPNSGVLDQV